MNANIDERSLQLDQDIALDSDRRITTYQPQSPTPNQPSTQSSLNPSSFNYDLKHAAHPLACVCTAFFKCTSLVTYLIIGTFLPNVLTFIAVMIMAALDFWVVKNVTGRLLVGLRWWSDYDAEGLQVWRFQSFDSEFKANTVDAAFFWTAQIAGTGLWGIFFVIKALSLSLFWGILTAANFGLCALNLYGYYKCRGDYRSKINSLKSNNLKKLAGRIFF